MEDKQYEMIGSDGEQYGPFTIQQLQDTLSQDRANAQTQIRETGTEAWQPLGQVLGNQSIENFSEYREAILTGNRRLDVGLAFSQGSELFKAHMGILIGSFLLFMLLIMATASVPFIGSCVQITLQGPLTGGFFILILNLVRTGAASIGDLFKGFESFGGLFLVTLAQTLIVTLVILPGVALMIGGFVMEVDFGDLEGQNEEAVLKALGAGLLHPLTILGFLSMILLSIISYTLIFFPLPLLADRKLGFGEAFGLGFQVSKRNFFPIFKLIIIGSLVMAVSLIPCGLGLIFAGPWFYAVMAQAYEQMFSPSSVALQSEE
ncbi:MAG: hypothetical protein DSZ35_08350 [Verrucomicrobia bacterium]|nr:MAG: hypothetical protein DSZ35_08350 [Verrucomicrobiota bacterium]